MADNPSPMRVAADAVSTELDADIFLYSASISRENAEKLRCLISDIELKKPNALLILTTNGGDPDAAFLLARAIKRSYKKFTVGVFGPCKSAGTLVAVGADDITMADTGELGPLDIQLGKDDELFKRGSGLDLISAIQFLQELSWGVFQQDFVKLKSGTNITTKTAADIAHGISKGIVEPIASQIDPVKLGETQRSLAIVREYGKLLNAEFENLEKLISGYPSHGFVIDFPQAKNLFKNVRQVTKKEAELDKVLDILARSSVDFVHYFPPLPKAQPKPPDANPPPADAAAAAKG